MERTPTLGTLTGMVVGLFTIWWRLDSKMERKFDTLDTKMENKFDTLDRKLDDLSTFLRDTVLEFKGEIGELRGAARTHTPVQMGYIATPCQQSSD